MRLETRPRTLSFALKTLSCAIASAVLVSSAATAAGLGKLTVQSSLGQPLRAEIELTQVGADEAGALVAKLAAPEAFRLANIEFNPALLSLRFAVETRNGRQYVKISSTQAINEPFVDMLLDLSWNGGHLVREYTFLLDPAELRSQQSAQAAAPAPEVQSVKPQAQAPAPSAAPAEQPAKPKHVNKHEAKEKTPGVKEYTVANGDSLGMIATKVRPEGVPLDLMLVALFRANPDAFFDGNMNRLRSGQVLTVPDLAAIEATPIGEAHSTVLAHSADFNAYRSKLAGQVAAAPAAKEAAESQSAGGKIKTKVEETPTAVNTAKDQLKLSKATAAAGATGKNTTAHAEDALARERELSDAKNRIKELERNVGDLEKMVTLQKSAKPAASKPPLPAVSAKASLPSISASVSAPPPKPAAKPAVKKAAPPPEPSIVDMLMENLNIVGAVLGAAVLLVVGVIMRRRKAKQGEPVMAEPSLMGAPSTKGPELFAETGGQSVDTNNSVFNSSFAPSASQLDTNEVDPVAEADVYIAYGRDAQAEEILKEALRTHPERNPVRLKLLEIYATRKDQRAFEAQASELYSMSKGQGDDWAQAAALGLTIDPLNPLYQSAAPEVPELPSEPVFEETAAPSALDLDLSADAPTAAPEPAPAPPDEHTLDFDLGGLDFKKKEAAPAPAPAAAPMAAATSATEDLLADMSFDDMVAKAPAPTPAPAPEDDLMSMNFDMGLDMPAAPAAAPSPAADLGMELDDLGLDDLGLDLGMSETSAPTAAPASADFDMADLAAAFDLPAAPGPSPAPQEDPLAALDAMDFDMPVSAPAEPKNASSDPLADFSMDDFAMPDTAASAPAPTPAATDFDLSSIDLDLPQPMAEDTTPEFKDENIGAMAEPPGELSPEHMEMETKLDLALAYQEIGDKEGARELIDEVLKGGSAGQITKANEMLALLG